MGETEMTEDERDERRKLTPADTKMIRFAILVENRTIREVSNSYGISTKYSKRLITQATRTDNITTTQCSGCHYSYSDINAHYLVWTSGFTHELSCGDFAP